jgi:excinuclease ABC subunit C
VHGLFPRPEFTCFGPTRFLPSGESSPCYRIEASASRSLRGLIRRDVPRVAGVYGMLDGSGRLIYVGKASRLRVRLLSYFRRKGRDRKAARIAAQARTILWEPLGHEFIALLRELELIRRWRPAYNVQGQPRGGRFAFVCLGRSPAPYLYLSRTVSRNSIAAFGPVRPRWRIREAIRLLNDLFRLRDCPRQQTMIFADEAGLFTQPLTAGCLRHELGNCLGPCAALCSAKDYARQARAANAFLSGASDRLLRQLQTEMASVSRELAFERAAVLRDRLETLQSFRQSLERVRDAQERHSFIYEVAGSKGQAFWLILSAGRVVGVLPAPRADGERRTVEIQALEMLAHHPPGLPVTGEELDEVLLVAAWFRKYPEERRRTRPLPHGFQASSPFSTLQSLPKKPATRMPSAPFSSISVSSTSKSGKPVPETK